MASSKGVMSKEASNLNPPKDDPISVEELSRSDGSDSSHPTLVAIKGTVFDVSGNPAYAPGGSYHGMSGLLGLPPKGTPLLNTFLPVFAGKDSSRALACSSLKPEDCRPDWHDLDDKEKGVLEDWFRFFSKRYNIVGKVEGAANL